MVMCVFLRYKGLVLLRYKGRERLPFSFRDVLSQPVPIHLKFRRFISPLWTTVMPNCQERAIRPGKHLMCSDDSILFPPATLPNPSVEHAGSYAVHHLRKTRAVGSLAVSERSFDVKQKHRKPWKVRG